MNATKMKQETVISTQEQWSLLMDGELSASEVDELLAQCDGDDDSLMRDWYTYHVIGDVLRSPDLAHAHTTLATDSFMDEFRKRLEKEPLIVAPTVLQPSAKKRSYLRLQWPHWAGWGAASGFVLMAVMAVVYTVQDDHIMPVRDSAVVAAAPVGSPRGGISANTQAQTYSSVSRTSASLANLASPAWVFSARTPTARSMPAQLEARATPLGVVAQSSALLPNIRLDTTAEGRVWRDQRFDPYISAHQQFGNGAVFNMPNNGYMRSSLVSKNSEH